MESGYLIANQFIPCKMQNRDMPETVLATLQSRIRELEAQLAKANELIGNPIRKSGWWGLPNITIRSCGPQGEVMAVPEPGYIINEHGEVEAKNAP